MSWEHKGIRIDVEDSGHFTAEVADLKLREPTLGKIKESIASALTKKKPTISLDVVGILEEERNNRWDAPKVKPKPPCVAARKLVGLNRTTREFMFEPPLKKESLTNVMPDTPSNRVHLEKYLQMKEAWNEMEEEHSSRQFGSKGYGRLYEGDYPKELARLEDEYYSLKVKGDLKP